MKISSLELYLFVISALVSLSGCGGLSPQIPAAQATLQVLPQSLNFASQTVGATSAPQSVTIHNSGKSLVTIGSLTVTSNQFSLKPAVKVPFQLRPGADAKILIAFSPRAVGASSGSLQISASPGHANYSAVLSGSGKQATNPPTTPPNAPPGASPSPTPAVTISTGSLPGAVVGQSYSAAMSASGGTPPYSWKLASGEIPSGLALDASTGKIDGTTSAAGTFNLTVKATDSTKPSALSASKSFTVVVSASSLDVYGGAVQAPCAKGPAAHFYVEKSSGRWHLCTPAGNYFWLAGVYHADASDTGVDYQQIDQKGNACKPKILPTAAAPCSVIMQKYGDNNVTWGPQTIRRLKSWGFNTAAEYASAYILPTTTNEKWPTSDHSNPEKIAFTGLFWPSHYSRLKNSFAEPVKDLVAPMKASTFTGYRHPMADSWDPNFLQWIQKTLADKTNPVYQWIHSPHSDFLLGLNVDDTDELMGFGAGSDFPTLTNGKVDSGTGRQEPHLGWIILVTPPTQSSGKDANGSSISYKDTVVYSKVALGNWLQTRYSGSISALNSAWGSDYTSFGSSGGWGAGSGVLDEDGSHSWIPRDPYQLSDANSAVKKDLDDFLLYHASHYFSIIKSALNTAAPGVLYLGPTSLGAWGDPPRQQVLQAAAQSVDVISISPAPTLCLNCTDDQARIDFISRYGGDKPWIEWEGFFAQSDSYMSVYPAPDTAMPQAADQDARGVEFQKMMTSLWQTKDSSTSTFHVVGYKWWELYDNRGEKANWGLLTRRDNAYDGRETVTSFLTDALGLLVGGEQKKYGDFIDPVTKANAGTYKTLLGLK